MQNTLPRGHGLNEAVARRLDALIRSQPPMPPWTLMMLLHGGHNRYSKVPVQVPYKRQRRSGGYEDGGMPVDAPDPYRSNEQSTQSIMWSLRARGWSRTAINHLFMDFHLPGLEWFSWNGRHDREFARSYEHADISVKALRAKPKVVRFHVHQHIADHVWTYIYRHPGVGVKEMRADVKNLLPNCRASRRNGLIDASRALLLDDGMIRVEVGKYGKKAHHSTIEAWSPDDVDWSSQVDLTTGEIDALLSPTLSPALTLPTPSKT